MPGAGATTGGVSNEADCYWVQVGAFSDADNARRARDRLRQAGEKAVVIEGPSDLDRVRIGPFDSRDDAVKTRDRVVEQWPHATVVECGG